MTTLHAYLYRGRHRSSRRGRPRQPVRPHWGRASRRRLGTYPAARIAIVSMSIAALAFLPFVTVAVDVEADVVIPAAVVSESPPDALPVFRCSVPDTEAVVGREGSRVRPAKTGGGR